MNTVICVVGPTASGKTGLAVELALALGTEIISADSMQIYRHMDIGTAKPDAAERRGVTHHMMDIIDPAEDYSAARYTQEAAVAADGIIARGRVPVIAGGTGFYIAALTGEINFTEEPASPEIRAKLTDESRRLGGEALYERLRERDPSRAEALHPNDTLRIIRALEIIESTGAAASVRGERNVKPRYRAVKIGLEWPSRDELYRRIERRVGEMFRRGLVDEAAEVRSMSPGKTASQAIGYKELFKYFDGLCTLDEAREDIVLKTRRYAKRQLTWFRHDTGIKWFDARDAAKCFNEAFDYISQNI